MKNDLIQVDNKFYIKSKVVMLPTNKASKIHKLGEELGYTNEANNNPLSTQQNLYFLSDEIIPFGSYYYKNEDIYKYSVEKAPPGRGAMLVIATTDFELNKQGIPRPSNEFLQKYCELGGINEGLSSSRTL